LKFQNTHNLESYDGLHVKEKSLSLSLSLGNPTIRKLKKVGSKLLGLQGLYCCIASDEDDKECTTYHMAQVNLTTPLSEQPHWCTVQQNFWKKKSQNMLV
jgi:hypothetical protein